MNKSIKCNHEFIVLDSEKKRCTKCNLVTKLIGQKKLNKDG